MKKKIILLMSGGVDSSVAGYLLKKDWDVCGVTMKTGTCDVLAAKKVADALEIPHYVLETEEIFRHFVIEKTIESRRCGLTPNPCADCNRDLKFGIVPQLMREKFGLDADIATGHYAAIINEGGNFYLARADNIEKDQSYFLCDIPKEILPKLHFPLSHLTKNMVREIAREAKLEVSEKPESMDACFEIPKHSLSGDIVTMSGKIIGRHTGIYNYTVGQRKGLGISHAEPLFVLKIDTAANQLVVGTKEQAFTREVKAQKINILAPDLLGENFFYAKTRSRGEPAPCEITEIDEDDKKISVRFKEPTFAPTPGQRLVCYNERGILVVSGII